MAITYLCANTYQNMKQVKPKSIVKSAQKAAKSDIKANLITEFKKVVDKFGKSSKKLDKQIEKDADKLAKKIVKEMKFTGVPKTDAKKVATTTEKPAIPAYIEKSVKTALPKSATVVKKEAVK